MTESEHWEVYRDKIPLRCQQGNKTEGIGTRQGMTRRAMVTSSNVATRIIVVMRSRATEPHVEFLQRNIPSSTPRSTHSTPRRIGSAGLPQTLMSKSTG